MKSRHQPFWFTMKAAFVVFCGCLQTTATARTSASMRRETISVLHNSRLRRESRPSDSRTLKTITSITEEEPQPSEEILVLVSFTFHEGNTRPIKSLGSLRNVLICQSTVFFNEDIMKLIINTLYIVNV